MKKYVAFIQGGGLGYGFFGKEYKRYIPVLQKCKKKYGSLKNFAKKYGYSYKGNIEKSCWVVNDGMKIFAVEVA